MNNLDRQYTDLLKTILEHGTVKKDRTGTGTKSIFGYTIRHNMKDGFPLLTTKQMPFKSIVTELLWFLRGDTNIKYLLENKCHIWTGDTIKNYRRKEAERTEKTGQTWIDYTEKEFEQKILEDEDFARKWGDLGPVYGAQWRSWRVGEGILTNLSYEDGDSLYAAGSRYIDQFQNAIDLLKTDPDSRRNIISAWNVGELDKMVLPPCHNFFQFYTRELTRRERSEYYYKNGNSEGIREGSLDRPTFEEDAVAHKWYDERNVPKRAISLMWNQRSVDTFLGLPFNIASYGLLLTIVGEIVNMIPDQLIGNLGDTHLYLNHLDQAEEQIGRELELLERVKIGNERELWRLGQTVNYMHCDEAGIPKRTREPFPLPTISINTEFWNPGTEDGCGMGPGTYTDNMQALISGMERGDFVLENYQSHSKIEAPLSN
jgi:thymidylate synthase